MLDFINFEKNNFMKEINLLEEQIAKLTSKEFDFRAWKQYSIILLSRIFGDEDQKVKQISKLDIDYSSWSLRDASGKSSQTDTIKKIGKEILQAAIDELSSFGVPDKNPSTQINLSQQVILSALESELKTSQLKELVLLINGELTMELKKAEISKKLAEYGNQAHINILVNILANINFIGKL